MMFTDMIHYLRARFQVEEGQTMAEYGVVLAVITVLIVGAINDVTRGGKDCMIQWR